MNATEALKRYSNTEIQEIFGDTFLHEGQWYGFFCLENTVVATLTATSLKTGSWAGRSFEKGTYLPGKFTSVQLTSGEVAMYA